jgi:Macrocin-O-methyltransferase (TylF)
MRSRRYWLSLKYWLTRAGEFCNQRTIHRLNASINYLEAGRWLKAHQMSPERVATRLKVFDSALPFIGDKSVLYLEFGVWYGASMRYWSDLLKGTKATLHGFDSFEGLPEKWNIQEGEKAFSVGGAIPQIDDDRVEFFVGWFDQTLPNYDPPAHDLLIVTLDCNIYSSTKTALDAIDSIIKPGALIYFDEFSDRMHELRAFDEYVRRTGKRFRAISATPALNHVMFLCEE